MKRIISLILTVAMLLSCAAFVAPVSAEQTREEFLNAPIAEYVELDLFQDAFATYAERQSADWYAWASGNITTIWPYKGIGSGQEPKTPYTRTAITNDYAFMIDLGSGASTYTDGMDLKTNPKVSYDSELGRYIVTSGNVKYKLGEIAEGKLGGNFAVFGTTYDTSSYVIADGLGIKERTLNTAVYPNAGTAAQIQQAVYSLNKSGVTEINLLLTRTHTSSSTKKLTTYLPVTVEYTDGSKTELGLFIGNVGADFQQSVYAAPTTAATYAEVLANGVAANTIINENVTNENITVPGTARKSYLPEESFVLATMMRNYKGGEFAGYAHSYTIPVDPEKTIKSIKLVKDLAAPSSYFGSDTLADGTSTDVASFVPVTIDGADLGYKYYIYTQRNCGRTGIFAMTLTSPSLQTYIDAVEKRIKALDDTYNSAQKTEIAEIMNEITALESKGIVETDYNPDLITKLNNLYAAAEEEIKAAQIASVESKITNMAFKYISSMRTEVEGIKAEYDALINSGILSSEFNADLMAKFTKVYDVYVMSAGLEDEVAGWSAEYLYTMYDDVKSAKTLADGLKENPSAGTGVVDKAVVDKIDKLASLAEEGAKIDTAIDGLDILYNEEQLETIVEIKAAIDEFKSKGGTDKGLANAEIFNSIYTSAEADLLQRDIDIVVEKIEALPELYTATADNDIAAIQADIAVIEDKGGVIPTEAATKLAGLIAQRDEAPAYVEFNLPYNKDVIESLARYQEQFRGADGNYVKDSSNHFVNQLPLDKQWTFAAFLTGSSSLVEEDMSSKLGVDLATNKATINGVPYQFGKIKTTVDGKVDAENNSLTSEISSTITVDVPNNAYSKLHTAMWALTEGAGITVKYIYADGSASEEQNVKKIAGYRQDLSVLYTQNPTYYKVLNNDAKASIRYCRAYMPQYDTSAPGGGYGLAIGDHILTPDDKKILDKIEFSFATKDAHIFAMTGQIANSVLLNKVLTEAVDSFDTTAESNIRAVLEGCTNIMASLDEKEISYDPALKTAVAENKNIFVAIESVTAYTDLDNKTFTVKFTGPVAEASITKALFAVTKNGEAFADYELVPVEENGEIREVKVVIKNDLDYESAYELTISREVAGVSGKTILTDTVKAYDSKPAVDAEITIENAAGNIKITNNMNDAQQVTAIVAVYDASNKMVSKFLVNDTLDKGESVSQAVAFDLQDGQRIECLILDSLTNCRKIYNSYIFE